MKEVIGSKEKPTPLKFKCKCGEHFISNEYKANNLWLGNMRWRKAKETCPKCGKEIEGGTVYRPLMGSSEQKKWGIMG